MDIQELIKIRRHLILLSSSIDNLGLMNGKMGISIFFYHYYRFSKKKIYKKYADELVTEIYDEIDLKYPTNFSDGLAGIAWGIEYLIRNKFVVADSDELLGDLDRQIVKIDVRKISDYSLETGLIGLSYYVIARYVSKKRISPVISMQYVFELLQSLIKSKDEGLEIKNLIFQLQCIIKGKDLTINPDFFLLELINKNKAGSKKIFNKKLPLGINGGYAGIGLKILKQYEYEKKNLYF